MLINKGYFCTQLYGSSLNFKAYMNVDAFLISDCKENIRKAQYKLYTEVYGLLMSICLRYMKNKSAADEILNQGFYKILKNLDTYNLDVPFDAWISRIMINTIIDDFRKNRKRLEIFENFDVLLDSDNFEAATYNQAELMFDAEDLQNLLQELPNVTRKVFSMFAIDDYKHSEIAKQLGISVNTSKWHVATARKKLKSLIIQQTKNTNSVNYGKSAG